MWNRNVLIGHCRVLVLTHLTHLRVIEIFATLLNCKKYLTTSIAELESNHWIFFHIFLCFFSLLLLKLIMVYNYMIIVVDKSMRSILSVWARLFHVYSPNFSISWKYFLKSLLRWELRVNLECNKKGGTI